MPEERLGVLFRCMDLRFGIFQRTAFEKATELSATSYWDYSIAGGATKQPQNDLFIAIDHGAQVVGMGAHGDGCGGNPGLSNEQLMEKLNDQVRRFQRDFSGLTVYALFSTLQGGTQIWKV